MLGKILKWVAIIVGSLVGILLIAAIALFFISNQKQNRQYDIETANLTIPTDEASIAEGERLVAIRACSDCHGSDFGGGLMLDDPAFGTFYAANLTPGQNSGTDGFTPADWDRAIRHGVGPDSKPLAVMPSTDYYRISDEDLARMIAYLQSLPPVDQDQPWPEPKVGPLANVLIATNQLQLAAEVIDHDQPPPVSVEAEVSAEYGNYLATTCTGCHGVDFSGGSIVGAPPDYPPAANLTPAGNPGNWDQEKFINTLRTGVTPEGKQLDPAYMPWPITTRMTDDELAAIWLYLSSLPAVETGS